MTDNLLDTGDQPLVDPKKNYLEELVGPGRKFATVEDMARGKYEADVLVTMKNKAFDTLRDDYLKLQADYNAGATLKELLTTFQAQQPSSNEEPQKVNEVQQPTAIDPKQIESMISSEVQKMKMNEVQTQNYNQVRDKLIERFGPNYQAAVKSQIEELGISDDLFTTLAKSNPKMLYRTLGLDQPPQQRQDFQAPPRSSQNSAGFAPQNTQHTWNYYQELKKKDPKLYSNPKTQVQMHKDYLELGTAFEDGDFNLR